MNMDQIKDFVKANPEKVAAGGVVFLLLLYLIISPTVDDTKERVGRSEKLRKAVREREERRAEQSWEPITVAFSDNADDLINKTLEASLWPEWFTYKRPFVPLNWKEVRPELAFLGKPEINITLSGLNVKVTWQDNPKNKGCTIKRYLLFRKQSGKSWERISELDRAQSEYEDKNLQPLAEYRYRLVTEAVAQTGRIFDGEKKEVSVAVETESVETPFPWVFEVKSILMPTPTIPKKSVRLVARHKFEGWESKGSFRVEVGGRIVFRAQVGSELKNIDTGCVLLDAGYMEILYKKRKKRVKFVLIQHKASGKKVRIYRPSRSEDFLIEVVEE